MLLFNRCVCIADTMLRPCLNSPQASPFVTVTLTVRSLRKKKVKGLTRMDTLIRGTQRQFLEYICSEDDLRSRIFGTFVVKFRACLLLLRFSHI